MTSAVRLPIQMSDPALERVRLKGTAAEIEAELCKVDMPAHWGPRTAIAQWVAYHLPLGQGWWGTVVITGYRTALNGQGTFTAYLSIDVQPRVNG